MYSNKRLDYDVVRCGRCYCVVFGERFLINPVFLQPLGDIITIINDTIVISFLVWNTIGEPLELVVTLGVE